MYHDGFNTILFLIYRAPSALIFPPEHHQLPINMPTIHDIQSSISEIKILCMKLPVTIHLQTSSYVILWSFTMLSPTGITLTQWSSVPWCFKRWEIGLLCCSMLTSNYTPPQRLLTDLSWRMRSLPYWCYQMLNGGFWSSWAQFLRCICCWWYGLHCTDILFKLALDVHKYHLPNVTFGYAYVAMGNPNVPTHAGITKIQYQWYCTPSSHALCL